MFSNIKKLQKKPEHIKRRIALFITSIFFLTVVAIWFSIDDISPQKQKDSRNVSGAISPFGNLKDIFVNIKDNATIKLDTVKKQYSLDSVISK